MAWWETAIGALSSVPKFWVKPRVQVFMAYGDIRQVKNTATGRPIGPVNFTHVLFENRRGWRSTTARRVHARVSFYGEHGQFLINIPGRWGDSKQPDKSHYPTRHLEMVDIEANEKPIELNIAMKYTDEKECYAFNNESYQTRYLKLPKFVLRGTYFRVCVQLIGENLKESWWFKLHNEGENGSIRIDPHPEEIDLRA